MHASIETNVFFLKFEIQIQLVHVTEFGSLVVVKDGLTKHRVLTSYVSTAQPRSCLKLLVRDI